MMWDYMSNCDLQEEVLNYEELDSYIYVKSTTYCGLESSDVPEIFNENLDYISIEEYTGDLRSTLVDYQVSQLDRMASYNITEINTITLYVTDVSDESGCIILTWNKVPQCHDHLGGYIFFDTIAAAVYREGEIAEMYTKITTNTPIRIFEMPLSALNFLSDIHDMNAHVDSTHDSLL